MNTLLDHSDGASFAGCTAHGEPNRILIVDDDSCIRSLETAILRQAGHHVDTASDGENAWQALLVRDYDLLVTDYLMPGVSGLALVRQLRLAHLALPVVMVSASLASLDIAKLTRDPWSHIHAFVHKPFTVVELLAAVNSALSQRFAAIMVPSLTPA